MHLFSVMSLNVAIYHILPKTGFLGYTSVTDNVGLSSTNLMQLALTANAFSTITQCNNHYATQGHQFWYQSTACMQLPIS